MVCGVKGFDEIYEQCVDRELMFPMELQAPESSVIEMLPSEDRRFSVFDCL
jgi:hypothetical protein